MEAHRRIDAWVAVRDGRVVLALCVVAMIRVFLFSAAFPFFNNVDEQAHFDAVFKYARGYLPREAAPKFDEDAAETIVTYATQEYLRPPEVAEREGGGRPIWSYPKPDIDAWLPGAKKVWTVQENPEVTAPPAYYILAGLWYNLGRAAGLDGGGLLYWIRFLNVGIYGLLVWVSYRLCRSVRPDDRTLRIGVPLILAGFPQDLFFSINSDVLSPLLVAAFLLLSFEARSGTKGIVLDLLTGALVAALCLVKISNFVILVAFACLTWRRATHLRNAQDPSRQRLGLALSVATAVIPVALWLAWNSIVLGDPTGSAAKIRLMDWTVKPLAEVWDHPIFGPTGFAYFLAELTRSFWRGEFVWYLQRIASPAADFAYVATSGLFVAVATLHLLRSGRAGEPGWRFIGCLSIGLLVLYVGLLAALSIRFDFGKCWYPSRELPYFTSGRLISGALVPFLMLYVDGLARILSRLDSRVLPLAVLALISILMLVSEVSLSWNVFGSAYNWFHLEP